MSDSEAICTHNNMQVDVGLWLMCVGLCANCLSEKCLRTSSDGNVFRMLLLLLFLCLV